MNNIRICLEEGRPTILAIVNDAAHLYRGVIPDDGWHEPYMSIGELNRELEAGVAFWGYARDQALIGVMGTQPVGDVDLIRHAYVLPGNQRGGVGSALISELRLRSNRRMLVGTWATATWAIRFYQRHGFVLVSAERKTELLKTYWRISDRQIETSVVLESSRRS